MLCSRSARWIMRDLSLVEPTVYVTLDTIQKMCSEENGSSERQCFNLMKSMLEVRTLKP